MARTNPSRCYQTLRKVFRDPSRLLNLTEMPPKKRAGRTIPKPTIMLEANLPPDLPAPTTTRNRQPRAQTTLSFRTTRQSTSRSEIKSPVTSQTRSAMQRTASPSNEGTTDGRSIQDADSLRGSRSYQQDEDGLIVDERTGHAPLLDDVESGMLFQNAHPVLRVMTLCNRLSRTFFNWLSYSSL